MGQRRKVVFEDDEGRMRLGDPQPKPWFQTYLGKDLRPFPIQCSIGDFTQPSMRSNQDMVRLVFEALGDVQMGIGVEFGAGVGNFTVPLASVAKLIHVFEIDPYAIKNLEHNLSSAQLRDRVQIHQGAFHTQQSMQDFAWDHVDFIFVDPPRSGVGAFLQGLDSIPDTKKPERVIYVSCFLDSYINDVPRLVRMGYRPQKVTLLDQFPQSPHFEIVSYFVQE
jgi:23S rRNA (uracil1939-C5)-methyltransferase